MTILFFVLPNKVIKTIEKILRLFLYRKDVIPKALGVKVLCEMLPKKKKKRDLAYII